MNPMPVRLRLEAASTVLELEGGGAGRVRLDVGAQGLADDVLRHTPPRPAELEHGIDLLEDALTACGLAHGARGDLRVDDARLRALPGLQAGGAGLTREGVEGLFQRLASRSLGTPVAPSELPEGRNVAAALLILRECMHHLGFERVVVPGDEGAP